MNFVFLSVTLHGLRALLSSFQLYSFGSIVLAQPTSHSWIISFLENAFVSYGYWIVFGAIMVESMGVPFPGETMLIIASAYAAGNPHLSIFTVVAYAASGAIVGDNLGYWIGREGGRRLIVKYGRYVGFTHDRYERAQHYLKKHGGKAVFLGRFVSVARTWIAVLVGAHHLNWFQFLLYNVLGAIVWASVYGALGYFFGSNLPLLEKVLKDIGWVISLVVVAGGLFYFYYWRRKKNRESASLPDEPDDFPIEN
jgi:membrane protein DedA with SNARE-associated domain